jgi:hypothetical protein
MARPGAVLHTISAATLGVVAALIVASPACARATPPKGNTDRIVSITPGTIVAVYSQTLHRTNHRTITGWFKIERPARPKPHPRAYRTWTQYFGEFDCERDRWIPLLSIRYDFKDRELGRRRYSENDSQTINEDQAVAKVVRYVCHRWQRSENRHSDYNKYNM